MNKVYYMRAQQDDYGQNNVNVHFKISKSITEHFVTQRINDWGA